MLNLNLNITSTRKDEVPSVIYDGNTVAWYDAQLLSTITKDVSDFVSRWNDRLGSGNDLLQATGTNQPKWFLTDGILFDGIDNYMQAIFTFNQPEMIYMVIKQVTWTLNDHLLDGGTNFKAELYQSSITPDLKAYAGTSSGTNSNLVLNTYGIIRLLFNGASSKLQINETSSVTGNFGALNMGGITVGSRGDGTASYSNCQIKEMIFRKVADGASDETAIYNYLANKHGI